MKIRNKLSQAGSTLLLTVVATGIIGLMLAAYLSLVKVQNISGFRSQAWNAAIPVIEAGIEDALSHLNAHGSNASPGLACDNWTACTSGGHSGYAVVRNVGDSKYNVFIYNWIPGATNQFPVIESRGFVNTPVAVASVNSPSSGYMFAATPNTPPPQLARGVRAVTTQNFLFTKGLAANGTIDLGGNNMKTDSYDSTFGAYGGTNISAFGDIATNDAITNSISVGNADVYGKVSTGPNGTVTIGPQGSVGDATWHSAGTKGIESGYVTDDMNVDFPKVDPPSTAGTFTPGSGNPIVLNSASGYYLNGDLSLQNKTLLVTNANTFLYINGSLNMSGNSAAIVIAPGASLNLYVSGSVSITGQGVANPNGSQNFILYGLPTCTSIDFGGNGAFAGAIYAPSATLTLHGGGSNSKANPDDFTGAAVVKQATLSGHFNFHYDLALRKRGPWKGYIITSWNEMLPTDVAVVPPVSGP